MYLEIQLFEKPGTGWNKVAACQLFYSLPLFEASGAGIFC
jgi:hypothetical protein